MTDENGYASTEQLKLNERGDLVFGTYLVSESVTPEGLKPVEDFRVTISGRGTDFALYSGKHADHLSGQTDKDGQYNGKDDSLWPELSSDCLIQKKILWQ